MRRTPVIFLFPSHCNYNWDYHVISICCSVQAQRSVRSDPCCRGGKKKIICFVLKEGSGTGPFLSQLQNGTLDWCLWNRKWTKIDAHLAKEKKLVHKRGHVSAVSPPTPEARGQTSYLTSGSFQVQPIGPWREGPWSSNSGVTSSVLQGP